MHRRSNRGARTACSWRAAPAEPAARARVALLALTLLLAPAATSALSLAQAQQLALEQAPTLRMLDARLAASRERVGPASALPDPKLGVGVENLPLSGDAAFRLAGDSMSMQRLAWMQEFPHRHKRAAGTALAQSRVARAHAERALAQTLVLRETAIAWIRLRAVERQQALLPRLRDENRLLASAVAARLQAGQGAVDDALLPRQEAALLEEREEQLRAQQAQARAALRRWVGAAADSPLSGDPPAWPVDAPTLAQQLERRPEFGVLDAEAQGLDAQTRMAEARKSPDWALSLAYQRRARDFGDMVSLMLTVDLPLFATTRQDPLIAAQLRERAALDAERDALLREQQQQLSAELAELQRLDQALRRERGELLTLAQQRIELLLAAYRGGRASLDALIAARRAHAELLLKALTTEAERDSVAARLHFSVAPTPAGDLP